MVHRTKEKTRLPFGFAAMQRNPRSLLIIDPG
jgi:hypothetical protein